MIALRLSSAVALCTAVLTGCAAGEDSEADPPSPTPVASAAASAAPAPSAVASPSPAVRAVDASYAGGKVTGTSGREDVAVGERVVLRIASDVAEQVHVHGYDLQQAVPAGGTVDIPLHATIPGVFEVELHESGKVLFQLRVA